MGKKKAAAGAAPVYAPIDLDTGEVKCLGCGTLIGFLPPELPEAGPYSVNHTGCPGATTDSSPAGPNIDGLYETINLIDRGQVEAYYKRKADPTAHP